MLRSCGPHSSPLRGDEKRALRARKLATSQVDFSPDFGYMYPRQSLLINLILTL
jgi:hypothetical protein